MTLPRSPLEPDSFFHIYNHAVGNENLFIEPKNYHFFLAKIDQWIKPCYDMYAYCLMPNHFHFLLKIKEENTLKMLWEEKIFNRLLKAKPELAHNQKLILQNDETELRILKAGIVDKLINEQFSHCFNSYVQSFNRTYGRSGSLLRESFKRTKVECDDYLKTLICYIHNNPVVHGFVNKPDDWKYSSYNELLTGNSNTIQSDIIISLFDDLDNLIFAHQVHLAGKGDPDGVW